MELSTLDYWYLVREWQSLVGGRIQKIYLKDRMHVLQIYNKAQVQWIFMDGASFLSTAKLTFPQTPSGYTAFLRKRIQGFKISSIELLGFDRIVKITVETKDGPLSLIVELFLELNSMVVKDGAIISALATKSYADRVIRGGASYVPPPSKLSPWNTPIHELVGKTAVKVLATELGLGGKYAEEVCARAGVDKKAELTEGDAQRLHAALQAIRDEPLHPVCNETQALPFAFVTKREETWHPCSTFNEAIDTVTKHNLETHEQQGVAQVHQKLVNKQQKIIDAQLASLEQLEAQVANSQRAGEAIYEQYTELKTLLEAIKQDWKHKSFKEVEATYGTHRFIKAIHPNGTIDLELP